jgi:hypothetical protein
MVNCFSNCASTFLIFYLFFVKWRCKIGHNRRCHFCVDFDEIFSPIEKLTSIRVLMSLDTTFDIGIDKMDVNKIFLPFIKVGCH